MLIGYEHIFEKCVWMKYLINIHKQNYQSLQHVRGNVDSLKKTEKRVKIDSIANVLTNGFKKKS